MGLLFINALKGLRRKKVQMLGIILMVLLSTGIYVTMNTAIDRLEDRYYNYLDSQNVEDFAFDVVIDLEKDISLEELSFILGISPNEFISNFQTRIKDFSFYLETYRILREW